MTLTRFNVTILPTFIKIYRKEKNYKQNLVGPQSLSSEAVSLLLKELEKNLLQDFGLGFNKDLYSKLVREVWKFDHIPTFNIATNTEIYKI